MSCRTRVPARAVAALLFALGAATPALAVPSVTAVDDRDGDVRATVDLDGVGDVAPGQTVEFIRDQRTVGYGSVASVDAAAGSAEVRVGIVVPDLAPLQTGDGAVFHAGRYRPGSKAPDVEERPAPRPPEPKPEPSTTRGEVLSVRDGVVLIDIGREDGISVGDRVALRQGDEELGRIAIELLGAHTAGGLVTQGSARVGLEAVSLGPPPRPGEELDYVALDFLGVVADLEHPTPHRAACHIGVPVRRVMPSSPAERGGVGVGDRVVAVDGYVVRDAAEIRDRVQARGSHRVRVTVMRGSRLLRLDIPFK